MSEEAQTTQDSTSTDTGSEAQAQAPSEGVLKPAAAIVAEQEAAQAEPTQTEAKADDAKADAPKEGAKDLGLLKETKAEESEGAPEAYEPFALPEGIEFDEKESALLQSVAKEMNLPQAEANKAAEASARFMDKLVAEHQKSIAEYKAANEKEWNSQPDADERILLAKKALDHAGLTDYVMEAGYQYDAKLMKVFSEFGKLVSEAKVIVGSESAPGSTSANPYPNSPEFKN